MKHTEEEGEEQTPQTDGGVQKESSPEAPFEMVSSGTMTRSDRYRLVLNEWVVAPTKIVWNDWRARIGAFILFCYAVFGFIAIISRNTGLTIISEPSSGDGERYTGMFETLSHPLGTDNLGRDLLSSIIHTTPTMIEMIMAGAIFTVVLGMFVGTLSGYKGGQTDRILMTITDVFMTIPGLPLVIVLAVVLDPRAPWLVGILVVINSWAGLARAIRSQVLTIREENHVEASRLMGISTSTVLVKDIIPDLMPYITVNFVSTARTVIFSSVGLYFIGVLPRTDVGNWGLMMQNAYSTGGALYTWDTAHWLISPMFAIVFLSFGLLLFAQGTDRIFNPRVRAKHASPSHEGEGEPDDSNIDGDIAAQLGGK